MPGRRNAIMRAVLGCLTLRGGPRFLGAERRQTEEQDSSKVALNLCSIPYTNAKLTIQVSLREELCHSAL